MSEKKEKLVIVFDLLCFRLCLPVHMVVYVCTCRSYIYVLDCCYYQCIIGSSGSIDKICVYILLRIAWMMYLVI